MSEFDAAWAESEATLPAAAVQYYVLELDHPEFAAPVYIINGVTESVTVTLEDGTTSAVCLPVPFETDPPSKAEGKIPECTIYIDNIGREIMQSLNAAVQVKASLQLTLRQYLATDLTAPAYGPVYFTVRTVTMKGTRLQGTASIDYLTNKQFPSRVYTIHDFPSLAAQ